MGAHARTVRLAPALGLLGCCLAIAPAQPAVPAASPKPAFVDRAADWGLSFRYSTGSTGKLYYPEIVAGGAALFDYDGDGDLDLFVVQGRVLEPGQAAAQPIVPAGGRLFRNDLIDERGVRHATPRFVDVTEASGIRAGGYGMGVAVGDFDNDGRPDLYLLNFGPNQLWHNNGDGTFTEVARAAGADDPRMSVSASFADLDRDGWLDLYVADYVEFDLARNVRCSAASSRPDYCGPSAFPPAPHRLLRNRGNGTFEDVSLRSGIARASGRGMGVVAADFDGDGWPDLFVTNDGSANFLFRNRRDFTFEEIALPAGVAVDGDGRVKANMGIAAGDVDDDGDWDLFVTHLAGEAHTLWVNGGDGTFEDRTAAAGLAGPSLAATGFGTGFLDYDGDGRLDLLVVDGAVRLLEEQARRGDPFPFAQTPQMFRNLDGGRFAEVTREMGEPFRRPGVSRGAAFGDVDDDGDTDVVVVDANGALRLLVNQVGNRRPWIGLRLVGRPPGARAERDMLGARVAVVRRGAPTLWRRAATDGSYASASDPRVLVGLGDQAAIVEVRVDWPDGRSELFPPPPLRAYTTFHQGAGRPLAAAPAAAPHPPGTPR
ncbi:MAG TPA: CRTAC1 family protein [Thermoanaerobaculia bacterium]|nr:CRTAC1 family protein [Thermoanaerobaculia bacterium]